MAIGGIISGVLFLGFGAWLLYSGLSGISARKRVLFTPTTPVREIAPGPAELLGKSEPIHPDLLDPVFKRPCCYYELSVEIEHRARKSKKRDKEWRQLYSESSHDKIFYCADSTGRVVVMPVGPEAHLRGEIDRRENMDKARKRRKADPVLSYLLAFEKDNIGLLHRITGYRGVIRLHMKVLRHEEPLYVLGRAIHHPNPPRGAAPFYIGGDGEAPVILGSTEKYVLSRLEKISMAKIITAPFLCLGGILSLWQALA